MKPFICPTCGLDTIALENHRKASALLIEEIKNQAAEIERLKLALIPKRERQHFVPPNLEEATEAAIKRGLPSCEGQAFIDHHEARGWMLGKVKMKKWQAAMGTWAKTWRRFNPGRIAQIQTAPEPAKSKYE
jgi:hypothetical protein